MRLTLKITHNFVRRNGKVQIFWEGHKNLKKKSPYGLRLHSNVKKNGRYFSNLFVFLRISELWIWNLSDSGRTQKKKKKQRWTISSSTWYDLTRPDQSDWMILCSVMMSKFSFLPCRSADMLLYHSIQLPLEVTDRYNPLLGWYVLIVTGRA